MTSRGGGRRLRRIAAADVLAYKKREEARRRGVMEELTAEAQKLELHEWTEAEEIAGIADRLLASR